MRIIQDETYARLIKLLQQDEKVALFQELVMAPTAEPSGDNQITSEVIDNGIRKNRAESKTRNNGN